MYCKGPVIDTPGFNEYPYPQPFMPKNFENKRDLILPNIRADMFFVPRQVKSWDDQWAKWGAAFIWQFTPIPMMVLWSNYWNYVFDFFANLISGNQEQWGTYPSMYNNWFAKWMMEDPSTIFGPFMWYDMFTWQGLFNWWIDAISLDIVPLWELTEATIRDSIPDWTWWQPEMDDTVDKNNLLPHAFAPDPFDSSYWTNLAEGADCNGNVG